MNWFWKLMGLSVVIYIIGMVVQSNYYSDVIGIEQVPCIDDEGREFVDELCETKKRSDSNSENNQVSSKTKNRSTKSNG